MGNMQATRDAFGNTLVALGHENKKIVVISGDLEDATRAEYFKKTFPARFFNLGIAEQDMIGTAVGMSMDELIPFASSFAAFLLNRAYDMIRVSVCYNNRNVKIIGSHVGLTVGYDGATAQCLEDIALTRVLPNMTVLSPVDGIETEKAVRAAAALYGPVYIRLGREPYPIITKPEDPFEIGKATIMRHGSDVTIIATGLMVSEALSAADVLSKKNISTRVVNVHTVKPLDEKMIITCAHETHAIVTAEEHQAAGGLGSAVCEVLAQHAPAPVEMIAVHDSFGESGKPADLLKKYRLTSTDIALAVERVLKRKYKGVL